MHQGGVSFQKFCCRFQTYQIHESIQLEKIPQLERIFKASTTEPVKKIDETKKLVVEEAVKKPESAKNFEEITQKNDEKTEDGAKRSPRPTSSKKSKFGSLFQP